jgi:ABC-type lipoprotein release transport system permease subunit
MLKVQLDYCFDPRGPWLWLGLIMLLSSIAALWPARQATRMTPRSSLSY